MRLAHAIAGPLKRRFFVLLALLAVLSGMPYVAGLRSRSQLSGRAEQINVAGSLRYRLLAIEIEAAQRRPDAVSGLVDAQGAALRALIDGDPARDLPACTAAGIHQRLAAHRDLLERELAPAAMTVAGANRRPPECHLGEIAATILCVSEDYTVDVTLIDAMLALTPEERLLQNDRMIQTIQELRDGFAARHLDDPSHEAGGGGR
jgi:hypothetical protein